MLKENALALRNLLGTIMDINLSDNGNLIIEKYLRARVLINVNSNVKASYFQTKEYGSLSWL